MSRYDYSSLIDAYLAVTEEGITVSEAAKKFGVPRQTLADRVSGRTELERMRRGPPPLFSEIEEHTLMSYFRTMAEYGYVYTRVEFKESATLYAVYLGLRTPQQTLGTRWYNNFMRRWPYLKVIQTKSLDAYRAKACTEDNVAGYFAKLQECLNKYGIKNKPAQIYNINEKGLMQNYEAPTPVSEIGKSVTKGRPKTTTIIGCANAIGNAIPPFFVFKEEQMQKSFLAKASPGAAGAVSSSGLSNSKIFQDYLQYHFLKYAVRPRVYDPILILYDGHKTRITINVIEWAKQHQIFFFVLPALTSHFLQPLDVSCFGPLETAFIHQKYSSLKGNPNGHISISEVCDFGCRAYFQSMQPQTVIAAFKKTGVCPFTGTPAIPEEYFAAAHVFEAPPEKSAGVPDFVSETEDILVENSSNNRKRNALDTIVSEQETTDDVRDCIDTQSKKAKTDPVDTVEVFCISKIRQPSVDHNDP